MREMLEMAALFARADVPVLIEGASGTGKRYVAQQIHLMSQRRAAAFRHVDLAARDDALIASDLFGHTRGSFTGAVQQRLGYLASTHGGTVFLDEIGKASKATQGKLLHVVEHREFYALGEDRPRVVDVRFVVAASEGLARLVAGGAFLDDLYQRIRWYRLEVPDLSARRDDIPDLVEQFAWEHAAGAGYADGPPTFHRAVLRGMVKAKWAGNLRGLSSAVRLAMIFARGGSCVTLAHCRGELRHLVELARKKPRVEDVALEEALERAGKNKTHAARLAGVSRSTIQRRAKLFQLRG